MAGQIYVEKLSPPNITKKYPLIFIHGAGQTGTNWLNTPDNREGWASYFLRQGYVVYLTDQPQRGRSIWLPGSNNLTALSVATTEKYFTAPQKFNLWPQAQFHTQWPGSGTIGDPIFDAFFAAQVEYTSSKSIAEVNSRRAYSALLDREGPAILVTHSQAGSQGWQVGDARPRLVKGIVALEPEGPPFYDEIISSGFDRTYGITSQPIEYEPPAGTNASDLRTVTVAPASANESSCILQASPAKRLVNLSEVPIIVVTSEASYHAVYDRCTVKYLVQAGVNATWMNLPQLGIHGNGHFVFMEKNNLQIAERVEGWLDGIGA
ncbi:hypothetical protein MBLNU459_g4307t2 [Dothideomycetes sp. NU459]